MKLLKMSNGLSSKRYQVNLVHHDDIKRKSYDLDPNTDLYRVLFVITTNLSKLPNYNAPFNNKFHVEVTKNPSDVRTKEAYFKVINGHFIDFSDHSIWCTLGGAFVMSLAIDSAMDSTNLPTDQLHVTIAHFGTPANCSKNLLIIQSVVVDTISKL